MHNFSYDAEQFQQGFLALQQLSDIQYKYNLRELVFKCGMVKLYHYQAKIKKINSTPTLIVFATVNRPEILDLCPDVSFIRGLLNKGVDVYLLDWGYPTAEDHHIGISEYVTGYLHQCVEYIYGLTRNKINLIGICQGGLLSLCYASLYPRIKSLVLISTPIDFHTRDNTISALLRNIEIQTLVDLVGNISGHALKQFFISMKPFELIGKKYLQYVDHLQDQDWLAKFLLVEKWLHDAPDQCGKAFAELVVDFYQHNKLIKNQIQLNAEIIDLKKIDMPVLNIVASKDEIVPPSASRPLKKYISSLDYSQKSFSSGHIGVYVSSKVGMQMSTSIANWLAHRDIIT